MSKKSYNVCASSELDIFCKPPTQTSILAYKWIEYNPTIDHKKGELPIEINITGSQDDYIDLSNVYLYCKVSIRDSSKKLITKDSKVGPINNFLHSMFKNIDVSIENKTISSTNATYPYRAYFETLLNYNSEVKNTHLKASMFSKDSAFDMESVDFDEIKAKIESNVSKRSEPPSTAAKTQNEGLLIRRECFLDKSYEMYGKLHLDIFNSNKLLMNNMGIIVKLYKNSNEFCLMGAGTGHTIEIDEIYLNVRKVRVSQEIILAHLMALEHNNALIPLTRVIVESRNINQGVVNEKFENMIKGPLPKRLILGMVDSEAFAGKFNKNPFNFQHFDIKSISLTIEGDPIPYQPFKFDFKNSVFLKGYYSIFSGIENALISGNDISMYDYQNGYTLLVFDLSQDGSINDDHINFERNGNLRINFEFEKPIEKPISVVLYYEFDSVMEITKQKNVIYDVTA
jgi:hypothetical protein